MILFEKTAHTIIKEHILCCVQWSQCSIWECDISVMLVCCIMACFTWHFLTNTNIAQVPQQPYARDVAHMSSIT